MIITILYGIFFSYCALSVFYLFLLAVSGKLFYRKKFSNTESVSFKRVAVLVPAYKEDGIIISTARHLLEQEYPTGSYDVFIIADSFQPQTLEQLRQLPIQVLEVSFVKSTKLKALNEAFNRIGDAYDIAVICDADNVLADDVLKRFNQAFQNGAKAVQGQRVAKNLDTPFAILDACSEAINNHIFRKGANGLKLSSSIIGSGMAFDFPMIKQVIKEMNELGGIIVHEDKILQLKVIGLGHKIYYLENALVFDEKVDSPHAFKQQRNRWVLGQFIYLKQFFIPAVKYLFRGNPSYFNIAVLNNLVLPRAFLFLLLPLLVLASYFFSTFWIAAAIGVLAIFMLAMIISLPAGLINKDLFQAILRIPRAIGLMAGSLFRGKKANKTFIHTVHTKTEVTNTYLLKKPVKDK